MPRSRARRMSSPGVAYPVQEQTTNMPTSAGESAAESRAAHTASLPSGSASVRYRSIRVCVDQPDGSSSSGLNTECRVTTPECSNTRWASARCGPA